MTWAPKAAAAEDVLAAAGSGADWSTGRLEPADRHGVDHEVSNNGRPQQGQE